MTNAIGFRLPAGVKLLPDGPQWKNRFQIPSSSSDRTYIVAMRKTDGSLGCDCPGWRRYRHCKHLEAIAPLLAQAKKAGLLK